MEQNEEVSLIQILKFTTILLPKINILNKVHMKLDIIQEWRQRLDVLCEQMRLNKLDIENLLFFLTH